MDLCQPFIHDGSVPLSTDTSNSIPIKILTGIVHLCERSNKRNQFQVYPGATVYSIHQYTPVYTSIHQYTPVYTSIHQYTPVYTSIHQYTPVYTSIHQYTPVYTSIHQYTPVYTSIHQYTPVYTSIHQYTPVVVNAIVAGNKKLESRDKEVTLADTVISQVLKGEQPNPSFSRPV
ncbi:hypothetical protein pdam_00022534 [Pocillopora damicornis]|uniref:Uncharacterized protein n=1 Tax=Pocillopora damicornis TaxID=46731 RepID=A0A3M6UMG3_POCDA|nr:hypothetical protein pdam_00022534 [Pocillopora damicornis]